MTESDGAVAFALETLVELELPDDPAEAIADELRQRAIPVSDGWPEVYRETTLDTPDGAAVPRQARVSRALRRAGVDPTDGEGNAVRRAVVAACDPSVEAKRGGPAAVRAAADRGPVGVLADTTVPDLARRALVRSTVNREDLDAVVTAAGCGWRPPHPGAFESLADRLAVERRALAFVGSDPETVEGVTEVGGTPVPVGEAGPDTGVPSSLADLPAWLRHRDPRSSSDDGRDG